MRELNPNHPVTTRVHDHWHKLCALVMLKLNKSEIVFSEREVEDFATHGNINIVVIDKDRKLTLRIVDDAEAERLAKQAGGLPV